MFVRSGSTARLPLLPTLLGMSAFIALSIVITAQPGRTTHGLPHDIELLPNLQTWDLSDNTSGTGIEFVVSEAAQELRFDNEVVNVTSDVAINRGPLEAFARKLEKCGTGQSSRQAYQRIYYDSNNTGQFERKKDRVSREVVAGCMIFHESHNHWHFDHFAKYELYDCVPSGQEFCTRASLLSGGEKVTFCIADVYRRSTTESDVPLSGKYGFGCGRQAAQGLSVGWGDQYTRSTSGQSLSILDLPPGTYCYVSTADPTNQLIERSELDNEDSIRLTLSDSNSDGNTLLDTVTKEPGAGC